MTLSITARVMTSPQHTLLVNVWKRGLSGQAQRFGKLVLTKKASKNRTFVWEMEEMKKGRKVIEKRWGWENGKLQKKTIPVGKNEEAWQSQLRSMIADIRKVMKKGFEISGEPPKEIAALIKDLQSEKATKGKEESASPKNILVPPSSEDSIALLRKSVVSSGTVLPSLTEYVKFGLEKVVNDKATKIWEIEYDPATSIVRRIYGTIGGSQKMKETKNLNPNQAAVVIAKAYQNKIVQGYTAPVEAQLHPLWVTGYEKQINGKLTEIAASADEEKLNITLYKNNRFWSIRVEENKAIKSWGLIHGKQRSSVNVYESGRSNRTANQQARFEALAMAQKKIDRDGFSTNTPVETDGVEDPTIAIESEPVKEDSEGIEPLQSQEELDSESVPLPMLAYPCDLEKVARKHKEVFVQPKLDGLRCIFDLHTGTLWSRSRKKISSLEHISLIAQNSRQKADEMKFRWLDGELYTHGMSIQTLNSIVRSTASSPEDRMKIKFNLFDVISDLPFQERWENMTKWYESVFSAEGDHPIVLTNSKLIPTESIMEYHDSMTQEGYEGVMVRIPSVAYAIGKRSMQLQKVKTFISEEFPCLDILPQENVETPVVGSFVMALPDKRTFHATPKCSFEEKMEMWKNREKYQKGDFVGIVRFFSYSDDGVPRFPVLLGFRHKSDL